MPLALRPHERDTVKFFIMPGLDYRARLAVGLVLLAGGLAVQAMGQIVPGALGLLVMSLLLMTRGFTNKPEGLRTGGDNWQVVTPEQIERVLVRAEQDKGWTGSFFNGGSALGCVLFVAVVLVVVLGFIFLPTTEFKHILLIDTIILIGLPVFFSGWLSTWKPPGLIEIKAISHVLKYLENRPLVDADIDPFLKLGTTKQGNVPLSARILIKFPAADESVIGLQIQVAQNNVKGTRYPYLYCCLLAREAFGLHEKVKPLLQYQGDSGILKNLLMGTQEKKEHGLARFHGEIVQMETSDDVEVVVVRQETKGTGYHTRKDDMVRVLEDSLELARKVFF